MSQLRCLSAGSPGCSGETSPGPPRNRRRLAKGPRGKDDKPVGVSGEDDRMLAVSAVPSLCLSPLVRAGALATHPVVLVLLAGTRDNDRSAAMEHMALLASLLARHRKACLCLSGGLQDGASTPPHQ